MDAEIAFFRSCLKFGISLAGAVRAGFGASLTVDALVVVNDDDAVFGTFVRGFGGTHGYAGRVVAMVALVRHRQDSAAEGLSCDRDLTDVGSATADWRLVFHGAAYGA